MKKTISIILLLAVNAMAEDLSGKWSGEFRVDGGDHVVPQLFMFRQNGNTLTGSGGPNTSEQYPIENGKVDGNRIMFEITTGEWKFTYDLKVTGERITGTLELKSVNDRRTATVSLNPLLRWLQRCFCRLAPHENTGMAWLPSLSARNR
jgi:hypothetical protein